VTVSNREGGSTFSRDVEVDLDKENDEDDEEEEDEVKDEELDIVFSGVAVKSRTS